MFTIVSRKNDEKYTQQKSVRLIAATVCWQWRMANAEHPTSATRCRRSSDSPSARGIASSRDCCPIIDLDFPSGSEQFNQMTAARWRTLTTDIILGLYDVRPQCQRTDDLLSCHVTKLPSTFHTHRYVRALRRLLKCSREKVTNRDSSVRQHWVANMDTRRFATRARQILHTWPNARTLEDDRRPWVRWSVTLRWTLCTGFQLFGQYVSFSHDRNSINRTPTVLRFGIGIGKKTTRATWFYCCPSARHRAGGV